MGVPESTSSAWLGENSALFGMPSIFPKDSPEYQTCLAKLCQFFPLSQPVEPPVYQTWLAACPQCQPVELPKYQTWQAACPSKQPVELPVYQTWFTKNLEEKKPGAPNRGRLKGKALGSALGKAMGKAVGIPGISSSAVT